MPAFTVRDFTLQCGVRMAEIRLAYETYGELSGARDNLVVFPTYYTGRQRSNEPYFGAGRALDPARHMILVPCLLGNGESSSPSNTAGAHGGAAFPAVTVHDNVRLQKLLIDALFPVDRLALVIGWSMGGLQAYEWAVQHPDFVAAILPFCATARCSPHNHVFLEGVKAALRADAAFKDGTYDAPPERGLRAFGRVYAGWAYSQAYFDKALYRVRGFDTLEALLADWGDDHLGWDANDLLCKLATWQVADVSRNDAHGGNFEAAMRSVRARAIVMPSTSDLYFTNARCLEEAALIRQAELRPFQSDWGHCAATPSAPDPAFMAFLDSAIGELLTA